MDNFTELENKIPIAVTPVVKPVIESIGLELYDLEFVREAQNWILRIYIDKPGGSISIDDCETTSRAVEKALDENDFIDHAYILEVSSPGLDRKLKRDSDFIKYTGKIVNVKLSKPLNKKKKYSGVLAGITDGKVAIIDGDDRIEIDKEIIAVCRLEIEI